MTFGRLVDRADYVIRASVEFDRGPYLLLLSFSSLSHRISSQRSAPTKSLAAFARRSLGARFSASARRALEQESAIQSAVSLVLISLVRSELDEAFKWTNLSLQLARYNVLAAYAKRPQVQRLSPTSISLLAPVPYHHLCAEKASELLQHPPRGG